jgi:hypothetical protein
MQARGRKVRLVLDYETAFNQVPTTKNGVSIPFISCGIAAKQAFRDSNVIRNSRHAVAPIRGNIDVSGSMVVPLDAINFGFILKAAFGAPTTSGTTNYAHKFVPGDTQPSFLLERGFTDLAKYEILGGLKIGSMAFEFGGDGETQCSMDLMGASQSDFTDTPYDATPSTQTFTPFNQFNAAIEEGGSAIATVTRATMNINFNLDGDQYPIGNNGTRADIPEDMVLVTGEITAMFDSTTLLSKAVAGTETSLDITLTNGTNSLAFKVPEMQYERNSATVDNGKGILITLPYRAYLQDNTDNSSLVITLTNSFASYTTNPA